MGCGMECGMVCAMCSEAVWAVTDTARRGSGGGVTQDVVSGAM